MRKGQRHCRCAVPGVSARIVIFCTAETVSNLGVASAASPLAGLQKCGQINKSSSAS